MGQIIDETAQQRGHDVVARLKETPTVDSLNNAAILGKSENCYRFFQNSDGIVIIGDHSKESYCLLEIKEGTKEYKAFNSLFFDLITINEIEKVKKLHK